MRRPFLVAMGILGTWACTGGEVGGVAPATDLAPDAGFEDSADVPGDVPADVPGPEDGVSDQGPGDVVPDEAGDPGPKPLLSARPAVRAADLVQGPNAWGVAGKAYVMENSRVRLVIQDRGSAIHLDPYGGSLIDLDLQRGPGEEGQDHFREIFPIVGLRAVVPERIEVLKDGSDGQSAVIRVTGTDGPTGILPDIDPLATPLEATIFTDYILTPDTPYVWMRTTVVNSDPGAAIPDVMAGDFLALGGASFVFSTEGGFTGNPSRMQAMAGVAGSVAYAYGVATDSFDVPMVDSNGTLTLVSAAMTIPANGGRVSFDRFLAVGEDLASVMETVMSLRKATFHRVSGTVRDVVSGEEVSGGRVTAFPEGKGTPEAGGHALSQARTGRGKSPGAYDLALPPGRYDLVFDAPGRIRERRTVDLTGGDAALDVALEPPAMLGMEVQEVDREGTLKGHIPAKASLLCLEDTPAPWAELGDREGRGLCAVHYNPDGKALAQPVMPGRYRVIVSRGPEYEVFEEPDLVIDPGQTKWLDVRLLRSVETSGFLSADLHQHTIGSIDAEMTHEQKVIENAVENVEIAGCTDHDMMTSYRPAIDRLRLWDFVTAYDGDEVSVSLVAHFNIFTPVGSVLRTDRTAGDLLPFVGGQFYANRPIEETLAAALEVPGVSLIQMNHPRDGHAYLSWLRWDPVQGRSLDDKTLFTPWHLIEVKDSLGQPEDFLATADATMSQIARNSPARVPVLRDWFSLLQRGPITAVANSDAHNRNDGVGSGRNWVRVGTDRPGDVAVETITRALAAQKVVAGNGIFVRVIHEGKDAMGTEEPVVPPNRDEVVIRLVVQAPTWVDVNHLEVYANGRPLPVTEVAGVLLQDVLVPPDQHLRVPLPLSTGIHSPTTRMDAILRLYPDRDTWYVFVVRGSGTLSPVGRGVPFAFTNPIYVDLDGNGFGE